MSVTQNENWTDNNSDNRSGYDNETADPTIVNPEIVEQPEPVIVQEGAK